MTLKTARQKYGKYIQMMMSLLNRVENIVANGEIVHYEQFFHFPHCFQKSFAADASKCVCKWERVMRQTEQFLFFKQCFRIYSKNALLLREISYIYLLEDVCFRINIYIYIYFSKKYVQSISIHV